MWQAAWHFLNIYKHATITKTTHSSQHAALQLLRLHVQHGWFSVQSHWRNTFEVSFCFVLHLCAGVRKPKKKKIWKIINILYFAYRISFQGFLLFLSHTHTLSLCTLSLACAGFQCSVQEENNSGILLPDMVIMHYKHVRIMWIIWWPNAGSLEAQGQKRAGGVLVLCPCGERNWGGTSVWLTAEEPSDPANRRAPFPVSVLTPPPTQSLLSCSH